MTRPQFNTQGRSLQHLVSPDPRFLCQKLIDPSFAGIFALVPLIGAWNSNNVGGSLKRGVGIAMQVGFGNLGGAIAGFVYLAKDEPR